MGHGLAPFFIHLSEAPERRTENPSFVLPYGPGNHFTCGKNSVFAKSEALVNEQDRSDIESAKNGDHQAFRHLVDRYEADVARLMWRFSQDAVVCEELVQEVFVEAYFSLDSYRFKAPFVFWLKTIATRVGYRLWKRNARERKHVHLDETAEIEAPPQDFGDRADISRLVHRLLDKLAPADRIVLTLMYFDKCSIREIGDRMGWTVPVVKTRAYRARKKMLAIAEKEHVLDEIEWTS